MPSSPQERILSCLKALAIGDAIGKQTETLSRDERPFFGNTVERQRSEKRAAPERLKRQAGAEAGRWM